MFYYKQFLTISLIVVSLTIMSSKCICIIAYEHIQSPRQQIESGIMPNEITCRDDLIRVMRNNGDVACVSELYAEKLGWSQIPNKTSQLILKCRQTCINRSLQLIFYCKICMRYSRLTR